MKLASLVAILVAVATSSAGAGGAAAGTDAPTKRCARGWAHGVVAGRHVCLRAGQRCRRAREATYHRYGLHCHGGRLTREPPPPQDLGPPGAASCRPPSPARRWGSSSLVEARGTAAGDELWALVFSGRWESADALVFSGAVGKPFKIAWRMTGSGPLRLLATAPSGATTGPTQGPTEHGSNWRRPGDEWGSVFEFGEPGCWRIRATRDSGSADLWLVLRS